MKPATEFWCGTCGAHRKLFNRVLIPGNAHPKCTICQEKLEYMLAHSSEAARHNRRLRQAKRPPWIPRSLI